MTNTKKSELKAIADMLLNFKLNTEMTFKEYEAISNAWCVLNSMAEDGYDMFQFGKNIMKLADFSYSEEQLTYVVPAQFPRWEGDMLPWKKPGLSSDEQRDMMRSQDTATSDQRFIEASRPSIDRFMK